MNRPDFLIIGAQKSGTTTLFKALSMHPEIGVPLKKEQQFFSSNDFHSEGWDSYMSRLKVKSGKLRYGEASPHYLSSHIASKRIAAECSESKLIVLLRNPIDRAYSHYLMS